MADEAERDRAAAVELARSSYARDADWDSVLVVLRAAGHGMITACVATMEVLGVDLATAKRLVVASPVWADQRETYLALEDAFIKVLRGSADEWHEDGDQF